MISRWVDKVIEAFSPGAAIRRANARAILRGYQGAEQTRLTGRKPPSNRPADQEMMGPAGADALRAWGRQFARDNAYAWGVSDTIVASVIGTGIKVQSCLETQDGEDVELINEVRDTTWNEWCKVADINGQYSFDELQAICQKEMVEAGEILVRKVVVPLEDRGIKRPVPLALELIEADRLATDMDSYQFRSAGSDGRRVVRGVELDEQNKPVAYWIYPQHPADNYTTRRKADRIPADQIIHLFRKDRVSQTRGVTWFAPVMQWMRDLNTYMDNEMQAGAVASCATAMVRTQTPMPGTFGAPSTSSQTDDNGNRYAYLEPGAVFYLQPGEDVTMVNPSRPNSGAEPWINLMLRGIAVGTGLSYEIVARDFSQTNYSSNRASQLEDRRRFRRWQRYIIEHLCEPVWREFCIAASMVGKFGFPDLSYTLDDTDRYCPAEYQPPRWEWVDPVAEQQSSEAAINSYQSTYADELGGLSKNWRYVFYQRAKEEALLKKLGLVSPTAQAAALADAQLANAQVAQQNAEQSAPSADGQPGVEVAALALNGAQVTSLIDVINQVGMGAIPKESAAAIIKSAFPAFNDQQIEQIIGPIVPGTVTADGEVNMQAADSGTGEMANASTLQFKRNRKAIETVLGDLAEGRTTEAKARVYLSSIGLTTASIDSLIADALDGSEALETMEADDNATA